MNQQNIKNINFAKLGGLVPAIVQNNATEQVLMLGFVNRAALQKTMRTKRVWFYSRSKKRLWQKGEESKNYLDVVDITLDCDRDSLLIRAELQGPTCHTNAVSCFASKNKTQNISLASLYATILKRKKTRPKNSYTATLLAAGIKKINKKIIEEATEVVLASATESKQRLAEESCDLLYHLLVLLAARNIPLAALGIELAQRANQKNPPR